MSDMFEAAPVKLPHVVDLAVALVRVTSETVELATSPEATMTRTLVTTVVTVIVPTFLSLLPLRLT